MRLRSDNAALISFPMISNSLGCYKKSQTRPTTQSATKDSIAGHMMSRLGFTIAADEVIETHEHEGEFIALIQLPVRTSTLS
jgi:hypothetical protein